MIRDSAARRAVLGSVVLLFLICLLTQAWNPVYAHFNTLAPDTDVQLQWPIPGSYSMSIDLKILNSPETDAAIFWGHQFSFANNETGYLTLGIGGNTKVASYGVFDAVQANPNNSSGACDNSIAFLKTGAGWECFVFYNWRIGYDYRLQVSRISDANGSEQWQGSVYDYSENSDTIIGNILVPPAYGQLGSVSSTWDEYATASSCNTTPTSVVFSYPYALSSGGDHAPSEAEVTYGNTTCQDSNVQYLGGGAYQADAGNGVVRSTQAKTWLWTAEPSLVSQSEVSAAEFTFADPVLLLVLASAVVGRSFIGRTGHRSRT